MKLIYKIIILVYCNFILVIVNLKSVVCSFDRVLLKNKDICLENVNNCTKLSDILPNSTCLDLELPYKFTYENVNQHINLDHWLPLRAIPHCWSYLQKLLCSLKYPECTQSNSNWLVKKPAQDICLATKRGCPFLLSQSREDNTSTPTNFQTTNNKHSGKFSLVDETPAFLDCDKYAPKCHIDSQMRFVRNRDRGSCRWPMVRTNEPSLWIEGFTGCSFYCKTPFFSNDEYLQTKSIFGTLGTIFFLMNALCMATLCVHRWQQRRYEWHPLLLSLLLAHGYLLLSTVGWLLPLWPGVGHSVVCRGDGAPQVRQPQIRVGEAVWCVVAFSLLYLPLLAASITVAVFFYSLLTVVRHFADCCCYEETAAEAVRPFLSRRIGLARRSDKEGPIEMDSLRTDDVVDVRPKMNGKSHNWEYAAAWNQTLSGQLYVVLISIALLVISLTIAEIRADPVSGVCVISSKWVTVKICLSLLPLTVVLVVTSSIIYLIIRHFRTIQRHLTVYANGQQEIHSKRIRRTTRFYVFIVLFLWTFWGFSISTDGYILINEGSWYGSLRNRFICQLKQSLLLSLSIFDTENESVICSLESKPIINVFILHNCSYFSLNVIFILCSIFNKHSIIVWKRLVLSCVRRNKEEEVSRTDADLKNVYIGLHNKTLLDALWNPGVFTYLVVKKKNTKVKDENFASGIEEKSATIGSVEDSSTSYRIYHEDGSLRSCVSMPPIKAVSRHNVCRFSQDLSRDSQMCTTLDDFLKVTQTYLEDNSVRRSNSFAGRPCLISNSRLGNVNIPCSSFHTSSGNPLTSFAHDRHHHMCNRSQNPSTMSSLSTKCAGHLQNGSVCVAERTSKKGPRRLSASSDQRNDNAISSRSTLNRRKQTARYSLSPKSLSKAINQQTSLTNRPADPASCHSSNFSAESYNSYNLMAQQMGGRWRDICRTRMTLHDAMVWAKTASHSPYHNRACNNGGLFTPHQHCAPMTLPSHSHCCPSANTNIGVKPLDPNLLASDCFPSQPNTQFNEVTSDISANITECQPSEGLVNENSSDQFNSEDEMVSTSNSVNSSNAESGEFCSEDDVVSLVNSNHS